MLQKFKTKFFEQIKIEIMKRQSNLFFGQIDKEEILKLTNIVRETIAVPEKQIDEKIFSAADLWNIQRQKRNFSQRRFL